MTIEILTLPESSVAVKNKRIRRIVVELLWKRGAMTKGEVVSYLDSIPGLRNRPSEHSIASILAKNGQVVVVGSVEVESAIGNKNKHALYAINEALIKTKDDLIMTLPYGVLTKREKSRASKCLTCGRSRILPSPDSACLHCILEQS